MSYYILKNNKKSGPYSIEYFYTHPLKSSDLIWKEGLWEWLPASGISELQGFIIESPLPSKRRTPMRKKLFYLFLKKPFRLSLKSSKRGRSF